MVLLDLATDGSFGEDFTDADGVKSVVATDGDVVCSDGVKIGDPCALCADVDVGPRVEIPLLLLERDVG